MDYKDFKEGVLATENKDYNGIKSRLDVPNIRLLHGIIGINTEVGEIFECCVSCSYDDCFTLNIGDHVNFIEELGDIFYYIALSADVLKMTETDLVLKSSCEILELSDLLSELQKSAINLLDMCKKVVFYGKDLDREFFLKHISKVYITTAQLSHQVQSCPAEVFDINNKKLAARYGEKFSETLALNRNLENERKILEK